MALGAARAKATRAPPTLSLLPRSPTHAPSRQRPPESTRLQGTFPYGYRPSNPQEVPPKEGAPAVAYAELPPVDTALEREVRLLDRARNALQRGDAAGALAALVQRDREFPEGALAPETAVIRVQALLAKGDQAAALAQAQDFWHEQPSGAHASRIRAALTSAKGPPGSNR